MTEPDIDEDFRNPFLGEIETEMVGMRLHKAGVQPGERINVERECSNLNDYHAIRVENGRFQPVGYLPRKMASWLAPLLDSGQIFLDGYVPQMFAEMTQWPNGFPSISWFSRRAWASAA